MGNEFIMKPKVDFCFKELMADEKVRQGFIGALLGVDPKEIKETRLLPTILRKGSREEKLGILDVRVLLHSGSQMDLEMQVAPFELWAERSLFYLSKMYLEQIQEGQDYDVIKKCIHVGILDFTLFKDCERFYSRFHILEDNRHEKYTDKLEIHVLELPKLAKYEQPETELLKWAKFFQAEKKEEFEMASKDNEYLEKAYERLVNISADEKKRREYEARQDALRDYNWQMKSNWRQGVREGMKQGLEQGLEQGVSQGIQEGRMESLHNLMETTGMTLEEAMKALKIPEKEREKYSGVLKDEG